MSKMFAGLQKASGPIPDIADLVLGDDKPAPQPVGAVTEEVAAAENGHALQLEESANGNAPHIGTAPTEATPTEATPTEVAPKEAALRGPEAALRNVDPIRTVRLDFDAIAPLFPFRGGEFGASEQYRIARTKLLHHPLQPKMILVSSPCQGDGKTLTAINMAGALSLKPDVNVILIDADLRRASVASSLKIPEEPGLADVLSGRCELEQAIVRVEQFPNLYLLPAGNVNRNPAELWDSAKWQQIATKLRMTFRFCIMDGVPIAAVADYDLVQSVAEGVLMVIRPDHTNRTLCMRALEIIPKEKQLGVILNCVENWLFGQYASDYYYSTGRKSNVTDLV
jgi:capsular exopolysaccharide synthesis family protein